ncbi:MAG TPA: glutathione S-transferase family protein [Solirubrobacteraceae bacterium]|nr:glutathione S-transferase family protein [Solirubrobacteraceae bacterium]
MLLFDSGWSGNCYKVRLLFALLGIEYERHELDPVDRTNRPALIGDLNPALRVPTLVLDDGRSLAESGAILFYFAEGTEYLPGDRFERAQVLQWTFFEQYDLEPNLAVMRFWTLAGIPVSDEVGAAKLEGGHKALAALQRHLGRHRFLVGERYSIADIALYGYVHVAEEGGFALRDYPAVRAWLARVAERPGHITIQA